MKLVQLACLAIASILILSNCGSSKNTAKTVAPAPLTYEADVQQLVMAHCSPCHIPAKGGRIKPLDTYAALSKEIDDVVRRIQLEPGEKGFMPMKHPKLSDSTINVFKQWQATGMLEK